MIFPKGKIVYEDLNTAFIHFDELLQDLKGNRLSGYIVVTFMDYKGVLFMDTGNIINALEEVDNRRQIGQEAANSIIAQAKENGGKIFVYSLPPEMVNILGNVGNSELAYGDLTSDFVNLNKLIAKLRDEKHTGHIEITLNNEEGVGFIFMVNGNLTEIILPNRGDIVPGTEALPQIIETVSIRGALFNVYRAGLEEPFIQNHKDTASLELPNLLEAWGNIIAAVERAIDSLYKQKRFINEFLYSLQEKADDYRFLDPFVKDFMYENGRITFNGELDDNFTKGLGECLITTVRKLPMEGNDLALASKIRGELVPVRKKYSEAIKKLGLEATLLQIIETIRLPIEISDRVPKGSIIMDIDSLRKMEKRFKLSKSREIEIETAGGVTGQFKIKPEKTNGEILLFNREDAQKMGLSNNDKVLVNFIAAASEAEAFFK